MGTKSGKPIGRPKAIVDWKKIKETQQKYNVSENIARKIAGIPASTFYGAKRELKQQTAQIGSN